MRMLGSASARRAGSRASSDSMSITISASAVELAATRSMPWASSWVSTRTSWSCSRAVVTTPPTNCMMICTLIPGRNGTISAITLLRLEASARAPACGR